MKRLMSFLLVLCVLCIFSKAVKAEIKVSGKTYIDYSYDLDDNKSKFSVGRVYLNFKSPVGEKTDFRATTDLSGGAYDGKTDYYLAYIKYAYFTIKDIYPDAKLSLGQVGRPWVGNAEKIWEYRWLSKVFPDIEGKISSTGRGLKLDGKIPNGYGSYSLMYFNGAGYYTTESGEEKDIEARVTVTPLGDSSLKVNIGQVIGKDDAALTDKNRTVALISYQADKFTVAAETLMSKDAAINGSGIGAFVLLKLGGVTPFIRYDSWDPDTATAQDDHTRIIGGISFKLDDKVSAAIDYQKTDNTNPATADDSKVYFHTRMKY
jgi:hypothetical protein